MRKAKINKIKKQGKDSQNNTLEKNHLKLIEKTIKILTKDYGYPKECIKTDLEKEEKEEFKKNFGCYPEIIVQTKNKKNRLISITFDYNKFKFSKDYDSLYSPIVCVYNGISEIEIWYDKELLPDFPSFNEIKELTIENFIKFLDKKSLELGFNDINETLFQITENFREMFDASEYQIELARVLLAKIIDEKEFGNKYFNKKSENVNENIFLEIFQNVKNNPIFEELTSPSSRRNLHLEKIISILKKHSILNSDIASIENYFTNLFANQRNKGGTGLGINSNTMMFVEKHIEIQENKKILLYWQNDLAVFFGVIQKIRKIFKNDKEQIKKFVETSLVITTPNRRMFELFHFFAMLNDFKLNIKIVDARHSEIQEDFDDIIITPPYKYKIPELNGPYGNDASNYIILSCLSRLNHRGKAVLITPQGFLFSALKGNHNARKEMLSICNLKSIQVLPLNILNNTAIAPALTVFEKNQKENKIPNIFMSIISEKLKFGEKISWLTLEKINERFKEFENKGKIKLEDELGFVVRFDKIIENDYNLNPTRYSPMFFSLDEIDDAIKLENVVDIISGKLPSRNFEKENYIKNNKSSSKHVSLIRVSDLENGLINSDSKKIPIYQTDIIKESSILQEKDIVLSIKGNIGKSAIVTKESVGKMISYDLVILRPKFDKIDPYYLLSCLNSNQIKNQFVKFTTGTYIGHIRKNDLKQIVIPLKPLQEQKRITDEIRELQDKISKMKHMLEKDEKTLKNIIFGSET